MITYREFIGAIRSLNRIKILPRTLSFREVLGTQKYESAFFVTDTNLDDFAMFRYELNTIFKRH